jgi:hypothetical protein
MVRLLQCLLPPTSYYRWQDGTDAIDGVYLAEADTIHIDSHRREYVADDFHQVRRRVIVRVTVEETVPYEEMA